MSIGLPLADQKGLETRIDHMTKLGDKLYHKWLTPAQIGQRYGQNLNDLNSVVSYLKSAGFTVKLVNPARTTISFDGTVAQAQAAFGTTIKTYKALAPEDVNNLGGETFFSYSSPVQLPTTVAPYVNVVGGLTDIIRAKPMNTLNPQQLRTLYSTAGVYGNINGTGPGDHGEGRTVGISSYDGFDSSSSGNIAFLCTQFALPTPVGGPASNLTVTHIDGGSQGNFPQGEGDSNIQMVLAIAPLSNIVVWDGTAAGGPLDVYSAELGANSCDIITESYGWQLQGFDAYMQSCHTDIVAMAAAGTTYLCSAGDNGTAGVNNVAAYSYPEIDPNVLVVGGTQATTNNAGVRSTEVGWPGSGGGWSTYVVVGGNFNLKPAYQAGVGGAAALAATQRLLPDITCQGDGTNAGAAVFYYQNVLTGSFNGTSFSSPIAAAGLAIAEQAIIAGGGLPPVGGVSRFGRINDLLYSIGATNASVFFDVVSGSNGNLPVGGASTAGVGWDTVAGLGAPIWDGGFVGYYLNQIANGLTAIPGDTKVLLNFADGSTPNAVYYNIKRSTVSGSEVSIATAPAGSTTYLDSAGLANGTAYFYKVTAENPAFATSAAFASTTDTADSGGIPSGAGRVFTPVSMNAIAGGTVLIMDSGASQETVTVTSTTAGTFKATTTKNHIAPFPIVEAPFAASGATVLTPVAMTGFTNGAPWTIGGGTVLVLDSGANKETVTVASTTATTFTCPTTKAHTGAFSIAGLAEGPATGEATATPFDPAVASIVDTPNPINSGQQASALVTIGGPAPASGVMVTLATSDAVHAPIPAYVVVASGASTATATYVCPAYGPAAAPPVTLTAGVTTQQTDSLTVNPLVLATFTLGSATVPSGQLVTGGGTITFSVGQVGALGNSVVTITGTNALATLPSFPVTVAAGSNSKNFAIGAKNVVATQVTQLTATYLGTAVNAATTLTVQPPLALSAFTINALTAPQNVQSGSANAGVATLNSPAPAGGTSVTISCNNTSAFASPFNINVLAGDTFRAFNLVAKNVVTNQLAVVTATLGSVHLNRTVTVLAGVLITFSPTSNSLLSGASTQTTLTLSGNAGLGGATVNLTSSNALAFASSSQTIANNTKTIIFNLTAKAVQATIVGAVVHATLGVTTLNQTFTVTAPSLTGFTTASATWQCGVAQAITLTLDSAAGPSGFAVTMTGDNLTAFSPSPQPVTIPSGTPAGAYNTTLTPNAVITDQILNLTATSGSGGPFSQGPITVKAPIIVQTVGGGLVPSVTSITGGGTFNLTVNLTGTVAAGWPGGRGYIVALSSDTPVAISVPPSVTVPTGAKTVTIAVHSHIVGSSTLVTLTATDPFANQASCQVTVN